MNDRQQDSGGRPTLSVLLCIHRAHPWLDEAIESVFSQDDQDFEFLIAANACTDELWNELEKKTSRDQRVRLFRTSIGQLSFNLNYLANVASGEYVVRMDCDDVSEPGRLRKLRQALSEQPVDILGSAAQLIDADGKEIGLMSFPETQKDIEKALVVRTVFCHPTVAIRRAFLLKMRGYLGGFVSEDTDLWLRARRAGARMRNLPEPLLKYRIHESQSVGSRNGYAEMASHWLRELLVAPSWYTFKGFFFALGKALFVPSLPGKRAYKNAQSK